MPWNWSEKQPQLPKKKKAEAPVIDTGAELGENLDLILQMLCLLSLALPLSHQAVKLRARLKQTEEQVKVLNRALEVLASQGPSGLSEASGLLKR